MNSALLRLSARSTCRTCRHNIIPISGYVRRAHNLRELPYPLENGLEPFLSPKALRLIAVDYQLGLLEKLNEMVKGTEFENQSVAQTVISTAPDRSNALTFNYASEALNNSFFLDNMRPANVGGEAEPGFKQALIASFGSVPEFRSTMSSAALGMVGSGWVWLVVDARGECAVVATYGAGTMLVRSRHQASPFGPNAKLVGEAAGSAGQQAARRSQPSPTSFATGRPPVSSPTSAVSSSPQTAIPPTPIRTFHPSPAAPVESRFSDDFVRSDFRFVGDILNPIFCISVHEHAWLTDYGVWGKEEYLKQFWKVLDWSKVSSHYSKWITVR